MLDDEQFLNWSHKLNLSERAESLIRQQSIRPNATRARQTRQRRGTIPLPKMGVSIQLESPKNELAGIRELEHDPEVLEYYDQPPSIKLAR